MPLAFLCPSCRMKLGVADEYQGKQVRCPHCAAVLNVPKAAAPPTRPAYATMPPPVRRAPPGNLPKGVTASPPSRPATPPIRPTPPSNPPNVAAANKPAAPENIEIFQMQPETPPRRESAPPRRPPHQDKPEKKRSRSWLFAGLATAFGICVLCMGLGGWAVFWLVKSDADAGQIKTVENMRAERRIDQRRNRALEQKRAENRIDEREKQPVEEPRVEHKIAVAPTPPLEIKREESPKTINKPNEEGRQPVEKRREERKKVEKEPVEEVKQPIDTGTTENNGAENKKVKKQTGDMENQGEPEPQPEPDVPPPPVEATAAIPEGAPPPQLSPASLRKVKQATVYLRVNLPNGSAAQGSGFLCMAPRIVVTNAHVLGMLSGDSLPPTRVDVVLHSGESGEKKTTGTVLGVDRTNDLAVLRLPQDFGPLPSPLPVDSAKALIETQKVYIFGFPFGVQLGKNITVSESSVSSLRRDDAGVLSQLQVNGGMNPGNSGGPVTDTRGVVVGVSVAGIVGTQINFAIPGDLVRQVLDGRCASSEFGAAYRKGDRALLPVRLTCLDPLRRIRQLKLDVGAGTPGAGSRNSVAAAFRNGAYQVEIPVPSTKSAKACWIQPILVRASGQSERGKAIAVPPDSLTVLERKPVLLQVQPPSEPMERTLLLESDTSISIYQTKEQNVLRQKMNGKVLESLKPDPRGTGTFIRLTLADCPFVSEVGGKTVQAPQQAGTLLKQFSPTFLVGENNACKERGKRTFTALDSALRDAVERMYEVVCNSYESTTLPLPNRTMQPLETWQVRMPMFVLSRGKRKIQDIFLICTYQGVHAAAGGEEAHIVFAGLVKGRGAQNANPLGKARGLARFNVKKGFLTQVHLTVSSEVEDEESGVRVLMNNHSIVRRGEGNQLGIAAATRDQPEGPAPGQPNAQSPIPGPPRMQPGRPGPRPPNRR